MATAGNVKMQINVIYNAVPRKFGPCPKCLHEDIGIDWHDKARKHPDFSSSYLYPDCPGYGSYCYNRENKKEHFMLTCRTCHYEWHEDVS